MPGFAVTITRTVEATVTVLARNEDAAQEKVDRMLDRIYLEPVLHEVLTAKGVELEVVDEGEWEFSSVDEE